MRANITTTDYAKPNENVNFCRRQRYSTEMVKFVACVDQVSRIFFPRIFEVADDRERLAVRVIKTQLCIFSILSNGLYLKDKNIFSPGRWSFSPQATKLSSSFDASVINHPLMSAAAASYKTRCTKKCRCSIQQLLKYSICAVRRM